MKPADRGKSYFIDDTTWWRNESEYFNQYKVGIAGNCSVFDPPISYWCADHVEGGLENPPTYTVNL